MPAVQVRHVDKPWGGEDIFAHTDRYVGKILTIRAGHALSRQYHEHKDETIFVLSGELCLELGQGETLETRIMGAGSSFHITPGTIHRFIAEQDVVLAEVSTPELDDVVRLEDRYGRSGD
jgi:mannose-6-phosphate isomerase-like protein (cupin superfamily)